MGENQHRRQAQRQQRGLLRVEQILQAAGDLFAEMGYDNATTNIIAARAGVSPGSLYQFFPDKEAIAREYARSIASQLHQVYDTLMSSEAMALPFPRFLEAFIDALIDFNRQHPGYLALELASTISPSLANAIADLQQLLQAHIDRLIAAHWTTSTQQQRRLPLLVSYRLFLALLPLVLEGNGEPQQAIVREMKSVLTRYWEPIVGSEKIEK